MNRRSIFGAAAGAAILAAPTILRAQAPAYTPNIRKLRISTAGTGGNYHWSVVEPRVGFQATLGSLFPDGVEALPSDGSRQNVDRLKAGECDAAWVQEDVYIDATKTDPSIRRMFPVFRVGYVELFHVITAQVNRWGSLDDMAKAGGELGLGRTGGGTAETWRILSELNDETKRLFSKISPAIVGADYNRFVEVRDNRGIAQAMIEGPGSDNAQVANEVSVSGGKPQLIMLNIDANRWKSLKRADGEDLYRKFTLTPKAPAARSGNQPAKPGFYNSLLPEGGLFSSGGIDTIGVRALLLMRAEYRDAMGKQGDLATRAGRGIDQTLTGLRRKVNPFEVPS
jgi:TRAP-type uncharacterized transport system substrate-binding protein